MYLQFGTFQEIHFTTSSKRYLCPIVLHLLANFLRDTFLQNKGIKPFYSLHRPSSCGRLYKIIPCIRHCCASPNLQQLVHKHPSTLFSCWSMKYDFCLFHSIPSPCTQLRTRRSRGACKPRLSWIHSPELTAGCLAVYHCCRQQRYLCPMVGPLKRATGQLCQQMARDGSGGLKRQPTFLLLPLFTSSEGREE